MGMVTGSSTESVFALRESQILKTEIAKARAHQKWAKHPSQRAKETAKECWDAWQLDPRRYKNQPSFANDVLEKVETKTNGDPVITFNTIVKKYIPEWRTPKS